MSVRFLAQANYLVLFFGRSRLTDVLLSSRSLVFLYITIVPNLVRNTGSQLNIHQLV
jgi:hypothetical protein